MVTVVETYRDGIESAYVGELVGEQLYRALARRAAEPGQQAKLNAIADVEYLTHRRLKPIADRLQIEPVEVLWRAVVERRTRELAALTWSDFIAQALEKWPPYIAQFEAVASMAPPSDAAVLHWLVEHEVVLVTFARAENDAAGNDASLAILHAFLDRRLSN
jgi:hypothetical protein